MVKYEQNLDSDTLLKIIQKCAYDAFFIADGNDTTIFVTDSYERITGIDPKLIINKNFSELKKLGFLDVTVAEKVKFSQRPMSMILKYKDSSRIREVLVTGIPVFSTEGQQIAIIGNVRDVSELVGLRSKLEVVKDHSERAKRELEKLKIIHNGIDDEFVSYSPKMRSLKELAIRLTKIKSNVLITGESGVGKDAYAYLIHRLSGYKGIRPFTKISCGAIPEQLLESELFGYESGAFTGARKAGKPGIFEIAEDGIVFLDEIGELPLSLQAKLLNVLEDRVFRRIGGTDTKEVKARIIAATNKDLEKAVSKGEFRKDLFFRLDVINVEIPPLRERIEDIVPLMASFIRKFNKKYDFNRTVDQTVINFFERYHWPGNIRELMNTVENMIVLSQGDTMTIDEVPDKIKSRHSGDKEFGDNVKLDLRGFVEKAERMRIITALKNNITLREAAEELNIDPSTLTRKIQKYNLPRRNIRKHVHTEDDLNLVL